MRFAEPTGRQFIDVHDFQARMSGGEFVEDARCRVSRTIVDGNDFEIGIVEFDKSGESRGQIFFFVEGGKN